MSTEEDKNEKTVKSVEEVMKMPGNDELKFGVLIGLVKVQQASNKDVVDAVLNLVCLSLIKEYTIAWQSYRLYITLLEPLT